MEQRSSDSSRPPNLMRRRRHGRGRRGPVVPMHLPAYRNRPERFDDAVMASVQRLGARWGRQLEQVSFNIMPVPEPKLLQRAQATGDRAPLSYSTTATPSAPASITLYRLPIEQVAQGYPEVVDIVHQCVVHELSQLWMRPMTEIDPGYFPEEPD